MDPAVQPLIDIDPAASQSRGLSLVVCVTVLVYAAAAAVYFLFREPRDSEWAIEAA